MANSKQRIGRSQIAISNLPKALRPFASGNKDALNLSKAGIKNLLQGTIEANRKKKRKKK